MTMVVGAGGCGGGRRGGIVDGGGTSVVGWWRGGSGGGWGFGEGGGGKRNRWHGKLFMIINFPVVTENKKYVVDVECVFLYNLDRNLSLNIRMY